MAGFRSTSVYPYLASSIGDLGIFSSFRGLGPFCPRETSSCVAHQRKSSAYHFSGVRDRSGIKAQVPAAPVSRTLSTIPIRSDGKKHCLSKVLVLGSGGFVIGQGGEFNYICAQCIKALKDEGLEVILVNPNVATIHTAPALADKVYFLAVNPRNVEDIIKKERPDGIILTFGGATAELCGLELHKRGVLSEYNIRVVGTEVETVKELSNRCSMIKEFKRANVSSPRSYNVKNIQDALELVKIVKFPVFVKFPYGTKVCGGPNLAKDEEKLLQEISKVLASCPYAIMEESLLGWKEYQYQVLRDSSGSCTAVSNLESINPVGIHTGDSIVVSPVQTLNDNIGKKMLSVSLLLTKHFRIIGLCDIKFALNPATEEFVVTDLKPSPSRSSVLASKARGYPMAYVATRLALGAPLANFVDASATKHSGGLLSGGRDVVVKFPRWDFSKFKGVSRNLMSKMKSVGEVMSVGLCFEEALQKAIRMTETSFHGLETYPFDNIDNALSIPTNLHIFAVFTAMIDHGYSVEKIHELTSIDVWFLDKIKNIADTTIELGKNKWIRVSKPDIEQPYRENFLYSGEGYFQPPVSATPFKLPLDLLKKAKRQGFSDTQISNLTNSTEHLVRSIRLANNIAPSFKTLDSRSSALHAAKNYIYATYGENDEKAISFPAEGSVIVLGAGAYRIGSSIESDWCAVSCVKTLRENGNKTILINCNPGTLSTDSEVCDFLFFEESTFERVMDIYELTKADSCILSVGGQVPQIIALGLYNAGVKIIGTSPIDVDRAEDRNKFSRLLDRIGVDQPVWKKLTTVKDAIAFANDVSYPIVTRPSYILSGTSISVACNEEELVRSMNSAFRVSTKYPIVISKFMGGWREFDMDAISYKGKLLYFAICQHLEYAGVHSGDATLITPPRTEDAQFIRGETSMWVFRGEYINDCKIVAAKIAKELNITGVFNMQMILKEASDKHPHTIKVLECNVRSSRSLPLVSKTFDQNFVEMATLAMLGNEKKLKDRLNVLKEPRKSFYCVRAPVFSWKNLKGADPIMGAEMKSTGEVACFSKSIESAFLMALCAKYNYGLQDFPPAEGESVVVILYNDIMIDSYARVVKKLIKLGYKIVSGTEETSNMLMDMEIADFVFIGQLLNKSCDKLYDTGDLTSKFKDMGLMKKFYLDEGISVAMSLVDSPIVSSSRAHKALVRSVVDCGIAYLYDVTQAALFADSIEKYRSDKNTKKDVLSWIEWQRSCNFNEDNA